MKIIDSTVADGLGEEERLAAANQRLKQCKSLLSCLNVLGQGGAGLTAHQEQILSGANNRTEIILSYRASGPRTVKGRVESLLPNGCFRLCSTALDHVGEFSEVTPGEVANAIEAMRRFIADKATADQLALWVDMADQIARSEFDSSAAELGINLGTAYYAMLAGETHFEALHRLVERSITN